MIALRTAVASLLLGLFVWSTSWASVLEADEDLIFFPQTAYLNESGDTWRVPIHGWVFEPEQDSLWRKAAVVGLGEMLEVDSETASQAIFKERAWRFISDNKRGKEIAIELAGGRWNLNPSKANGHFKTTLNVSAGALGDRTEDRWISYDVVMPKGDPRRFSGEVQLLSRSGCSVVSDIDDTIKVSDVLNKSELLANTFMRVFKPVPGMASAYTEWANAGAAFHYVSGSPWQLYPPLASFLATAGFPKGSYYLRDFRLKDRSFFNLFKSADAFKIPTIEKLFQLYPQRRFILVGDSGEKDPEVYGEMARRHPGQIIAIFIRNVTPERDGNGRYESAFKAVPVGKWHLFTEAKVLERFSLSDCRGKAIE